MPQKVVLASESLFRPANGVQSTRSLIEIHNRNPFLTEGKKSNKLNIASLTTIYLNKLELTWYLQKHIEVSPGGTVDYFKEFCAISKRLTYMTESI